MDEGKGKLFIILHQYVENVLYLFLGDERTSTCSSIPSVGNDNIDSNEKNNESCFNVDGEVISFTFYLRLATILTVVIFVGIFFYQYMPFSKFRNKSLASSSSNGDQKSSNNCDSEKKNVKSAITLKKCPEPNMSITTAVNKSSDFNTTDYDISSTNISMKPKVERSSLSHGNKSAPQSPKIHTSTSFSSFNGLTKNADRRNGNLSPRTLAIGTIPHSRSYSHPHHQKVNLHYYSYSDFYDDDDYCTEDESDHNMDNDRRRENLEKYNDRDDDEDDDTTKFHKLYPYIRASPYAKLCLPPTCQRIPITRNTRNSSKRHQQNESNYPIRNRCKTIVLWMTQYEYWTKFLFLFLPSGGTIIWKMLFRKEGYQNHIIASENDDDDDDDEDNNESNVSSGAVTNTLRKVLSSSSLKAFFNTAANNDSKISDKNEMEKKTEIEIVTKKEESKNKTEIEIVTKKEESKNKTSDPTPEDETMSLSSFRSIVNEQDQEHEQQQVSELVEEWQQQHDSIQKSPRTTPLREKDALKQYRRNIPNSKSVLSSSANPPSISNIYMNATKQTSHSSHPHISTIFPLMSSMSSPTIGLPLNDNSIDVTSVSQISTSGILANNDTSQKSNSTHRQGQDPPMNFFDAEPSSDAIDDLTQKIPVLPDRNGYILGNTDKSSTPLLVFVNCRSGSQQGHILTNQLKRLLNPIQIWDLANDGNPEIVLESFNYLKNFRILVCGGDGTVSWILSTLGKMIEESRLERWPPVAIIPLGTGNDLARIHGWGGGYSNESLLGILRQVQEAYVSLLDRWDLTLKNKKGKVKMRKCFTNYFGVGVDAQVSFQMHMLRESQPKLFFSRAINKAWYGLFGVEDIFKATYVGLTEGITLIADGVEIPLPKDSQGIVILNIDSYSGGASLWSPYTKRRRQRRVSHSKFGEGYGLTFPASRRRRRKSTSSPHLIERFGSLDESDSDTSHFYYRPKSASQTAEQKLRKTTACNRPSSCQDGLLDVVSVRSAFHLGQIRVGLSNAQMICQCHEAVIKTKNAVAMQVDGEPWKQSGPCTLEIKRKKDPAIMLHRAANDGGGVETEMAKLLDWAEERFIIDRKVHAILMKEFSRRIESKTRQRRESQEDLMISLKRAIKRNNFG